MAYKKQEVDDRTMIR